MEFSRSDVRLALRNIRDGKPFAPELMAQVFQALGEQQGAPVTDDRLPDVARELLLDRHQVRRLVIILNRRRAVVS